MTNALEGQHLADSLWREALGMIPHLRKGTPVVYLLRLRSGIIYVGASLDLAQRLANHATGRACRTTTLDPPLSLLGVESCGSFSDARHREAQLKHWSRAKKEALVRREEDALRRLSRSHD